MNTGADTDEVYLCSLDVSYTNTRRHRMRTAEPFDRATTQGDKTGDKAKQKV